MGFLWWLLGIIFLFFTVVGFIGIVNPDFYNKDLKKGNKPFTRKFGIGIFTVCLVFAVLFGSLALYKGNNKSQVQKTAKPMTKVVKTTRFVKQVPKKVTSGPEKNKNAFSVANPVPDSFLVDYLTFMDSYYTELVNRINSNVPADPVENGKFLSKSNQQGWNMYNKITYVTDFSKEKEDQRTKRTDVAETWVSLTTLSMDYDSFVSGNKGKVDLKKDEDEYLQAYKVAKSHF